MELNSSRGIWGKQMEEWQYNRTKDTADRTFTNTVLVFLSQSTDTVFNYSHDSISCDKLQMDTSISATSQQHSTSL